MRILRRWPVLLALAVLTGVLGAIYGFLPALRGESGAAQAESALQAAESVAEAAAQESAAEEAVPESGDGEAQAAADSAAEQPAEAGPVLSADQELGSIDRMIYYKRSYLETSPLTSIDPGCVPMASFTLSVTTDAMKRAMEDDSGRVSEASYTAARNEARRILFFYRNRLRYGISWGEMAEEFRLPPAHLNELKSVEDIRDDLTDMDVKTVYLDEAGALRLAAYLRDYLLGLKDEAEAVYGPHDLIVTEPVTTTKPDYSLTSWLSDRIAQINQLSSQRQNYSATLGQPAVTDEPPVIVEETMAEPPARKDYVKRAVRFGLLGLAGGLVLFAVLYACWLLLSGRVLSGREFNEQYGFCKLADVPPEKRRRGPIDAAADRMVSDYYSGPDAKTAFKIAQRNILQAAGTDCTRIALVSDLGEKALERIGAALSQTENAASGKMCYSRLNNLNSDPSALEELEKSDAVILAAASMRSDYGSVNDLMDTVKAYGKPVLGSIVLE